MKKCILYAINDNTDVQIKLCGSIWTMLQNTQQCDFDIVVIGYKCNEFKHILHSLSPIIQFINLEKSKYFPDFHDIIKKFRGTRFSEAMAFRFLMFHNDFYQKYDKFIYLDCDTEVYCDINELFNYDISSGFIGMREEITQRHLACQQSFYGNSGVILFDSLKSRNLNINVHELYLKLMEYILVQDKWHDQHALNKLFGSEKYRQFYVKLPLHFNDAISVKDNKMNKINHYTCNREPMMYNEMKHMFYNGLDNQNEVNNKLNEITSSKQLTFTSLGCECFTQQWLQKRKYGSKIVNIFSLSREYNKHASDINRDDFIFNAIGHFDEFKQMSLDTVKQGYCPHFGPAWYSEEMNWKIHYHGGYDVSTYFDNLYKSDVYMYAFRNYTEEREQILVKFIKSLNQDARIILFSDKFNETPIRENGIIYINSDVKNIVYQADKEYAKENSRLWNGWLLPQNEFNAYTFLWKNMPNNMKDFDSSKWIKTI